MHKCRAEFLSLVLLTTRMEINGAYTLETAFRATATSNTLPLQSFVLVHPHSFIILSLQ